MKRTLDDAARAVTAVVPKDASKPLLVAYSGGLDSTVLLQAVVNAFGAEKCRALHLDHQINEASGDWRRHCERVANELGVEITCESASLQKGNLELQARAVRYGFFERQLNGSQVLLMGHHRDDLVETRLWQLLTGRAMIGIPSSRKLGLGSIARPFLDWSRTELQGLAYAEDFAWIEDPSNEDTSFDRNWIRKRVIPLLEQRFPSTRQNISDAQIKNVPEAPATPLRLPDRERLNSESIRAWLGAYGFYPAESTIEEIRKQAYSVKSDARMEVKVASNAVVCRFDDHLHVVQLNVVFEACQISAGEDVELSNGRLFWTATDRGFDQRTQLDLVSRKDATRQGLTSIRYRSRTKSLKNVFQEARIPYWQRHGWPIIHSDGEILSVPGLVLADRITGTRIDAERFVPHWVPRSF